MSGGEQQMLAVGRAYMSGPKIMLLDEPSMGLAPLLMLDMFDALKEINKTGTIPFYQQYKKEFFRLGRNPNHLFSN